VDLIKVLKSLIISARGFAVLYQLSYPAGF